MKISVYIATSLDGFIARPDGSLDWLPTGQEGQDYGYADFWASVDALVMGRGTFEKVLSFAEWPYGEKPVYVLSHRPLELPPGLPGRVQVLSGTPQGVIGAILGSPLPGGRKVGHIYLDGGKTIQGFLREGLVDELTITRVPVLLGSGIPLFGALEGDMRLVHLETRSYPDGLVQSRYAVKR